MTSRPFGFGLSFTTFTHENATMMKRMTWTTDSTAEISISVKVTNVGKVTGDDVVFAFLKPKSLSLLKDHPVSALTLSLQRLTCHTVAEAAGWISAGSLGTWPVASCNVRKLYLPLYSTLYFRIQIPSSTFQLVEPATGDRVMSPGDYQIIMSDGVDQEVTYDFTLEGPQHMLQRFPQY